MTREPKRYPLKKLFYKVFGLQVKASYYIIALPFTWNTKTLQVFIPTKRAVYRFQCFTFYICVLLILKALRTLQLYLNRELRQLAFAIAYVCSFVFVWIIGLFISLSWEHATATINVVIAHFIKLHGKFDQYCNTY